MKRSFASLMAVALVATLAVIGCGSDSTTVSQPDTAPPLAPVVLGARGGDGTVGLWWRNNTEPDLAGYHVYATIAGVTTRMTYTPIRETFIGWIDAGSSSVQVYVTAIDWTGNESNPSATKLVHPYQGATPIDNVEGLFEKELNEPS